MVTAAVFGTLGRRGKNEMRVQALAVLRPLQRLAVQQWI
jgi:hypothetical protein